jgi:hypothetical protein
MKRRDLTPELWSLVFDDIVDPSKFLLSSGWRVSHTVNPFVASLISSNTKYAENQSSWIASFVRWKKVADSCTSYSGTIMQAMLVCKYWYSIAARSAYRTIILDSPRQIKELSKILDASRGGITSRDSEEDPFDLDFYNTMTPFTPPYVLY